LLIACKYEEIYPPELKDFVFITDRAYTKEDVLQMEFLILSSLSFDLSFPTCFRFLERYMRMLGEDPHVMSLALFMMELALIDVKMLQYPPSIIAAASLCQAYKSITRRMHPDSSSECEKKVEIFVRESLGFNKGDGSAEKMQLCCKELQFIQMRSMHSSLQAVRKKY
jgi:G2/mitotic-specific cyclin-B, other